MAKSLIAKTREALGKLVEGIAEIESLKDEMQDSLDNTPENFQGSEAYEQKQEIVDQLETLIDAFNEVQESV